MLKIKEALTFEDILLVPKYSRVKSRSEVDLSVPLIKGFKFKIPFIPANMSDIINKNMIVEMYKMGGLSLMHRFCSVDDQYSLFEDLNTEYPDIFNYLGASVGVKDIDYNSVDKFAKLGVKIFCIDIAHLDSKLGLDMIRFIHMNYKDALLIAGNVATGKGAIRAWEAGADIVKVGIGASGICSTRLESGAGVPQLTAIMEVAEAKESIMNSLNFRRKIFFISDGGHKISADCVKSLCFADMVMLGGMLSGTDECSGLKIELNDNVYVSYSGSSTHKKNRIEGVKGLVKPKGPVKNIITTLCEGLQSGCSYQNSFNLSDLKSEVEFVKLTNSGILESKIHGVVIKDE